MVDSSDGRVLARNGLETDEEDSVGDQRSRGYGWYRIRPRGLTVSGAASMGILGGDWITNTRKEDHDGFQSTRDIDLPIYGQSDVELHTDIDVAFGMSGQTDTGLTFGASIDLDESDGTGDEGASAAFDNRAQGGEESFISGAFGTLTMGDTDGALDWALQEVGIGSSLGDAHTSHAGYNGNGFADGFGGQIIRYDHSFGDFGVAVSANLSDDAAHEDIFAAGARYDAPLAAMQLGIGIGWSQRGHDGDKNEAMGVSLDADFGNGFRAILNWIDMGDSPDESGDNTHIRIEVDVQNNSNPLYPHGRPEFDAERYIGFGIGYEMDDWTFAANWGQYSEDQKNPDENDPGQSGWAVVANYDLGGGAMLQMGYSKSTCEDWIPFVAGSNPFIPDSGGSVFHEACGLGFQPTETSAFSFGVAMNF